MAGQRRSDRSLRAKLRSPRRPGMGMREHRRRFWAFIAEGLSSEGAAMRLGVSQPFGARWFRTSGGMAPLHLSRASELLSGRYLSFAEREDIARSTPQACPYPTLRDRSHARQKLAIRTPGDLLT